MNIFICNLYDSKKENVYVLSKIPISKDNRIHFKNPFLKNLLLEEINNLNQNSINNIEKTNNLNSEESEELQIIDYPYSHLSSNINLGNRFVKKFNNNSSIYDDNSYYNCFNIENAEERDQIKLNRSNNVIKRKNQIFSGNNNLNLKNKFMNKFQLDDSQIDIEDTIKGEDNINITKIKSLNKKFGVKRKGHNIKIISNNSRKKGLKNPLSNSNNLIFNNTKYNNNTFIKKKSNLNIFNKSNSKKKSNNNTIKYTSKTKLNTKFNPNELLNMTTKIDKIKSKQNNKNIKIHNFNTDNEVVEMNNYYFKKTNNHNKNINSNNDKLNKSRDIIRSIKKKLQKDKFNGINNNISKIKK